MGLSQKVFPKFIIKLLEKPMDIYFTLLLLVTFLLLLLLYFLFYFIYLFIFFVRGGGGLEEGILDPQNTGSQLVTYSSFNLVFSLYRIYHPKVFWIFKSWLKHKYKRMTLPESVCSKGEHCRLATLLKAKYISSRVMILMHRICPLETVTDRIS